MTLMPHHDHHHHDDADDDDADDDDAHGARASKSNVYIQIALDPNWTFRSASSAEPKACCAHHDANKCDPECDPCSSDM